MERGVTLSLTARGGNDESRFSSVLKMFFHPGPTSHSQLYSKNAFDLSLTSACLISNSLFAPLSQASLADARRDFYRRCHARALEPLPHHRPSPSRRLSSHRRPSFVPSPLGLTRGHTLAIAL